MPTFQLVTGPHYGTALHASSIASFCLIQSWSLATSANIWSPVSNSIFSRNLVVVAATSSATLLYWLREPNTEPSSNSVTLSNISSGRLKWNASLLLLGDSNNGLRIVAGGVFFVVVSAGSFPVSSILQRCLGGVNALLLRCLSDLSDLFLLFVPLMASCTVSLLLSRSPSDSSSISSSSSESKGIGVTLEVSPGPDTGIGFCGFVPGNHLRSRISMTWAATKIGFHDSGPSHALLGMQIHYNSLTKFMTKIIAQLNSLPTPSANDMHFTKLCVAYVSFFLKTISCSIAYILGMYTGC